MNKKFIIVYNNALIHLQAKIVLEAKWFLELVDELFTARILYLAPIPNELLSSTMKMKAKAELLTCLQEMQNGLYTNEIITGYQLSILEGKKLTIHIKMHLSKYIH